MNDRMESNAPQLTSYNNQKLSQLSQANMASTVQQKLPRDDGLIAYLDKDSKQADIAVLDLPEEEWTPCTDTDEKNPAYYWRNSGFLYKVYPAEGYMIWRYDESIPGNKKPIGVWIGPEMDEYEDHLERPCEVTVDKEAGTYRKTVRVSEGAAEEVDEEAAETGSPPIEDRVNIMLEIARVKRAKRWMEELAAY